MILRICPSLVGQSHLVSDVGGRWQVFHGISQVMRKLARTPQSLKKKSHKVTPLGRWGKACQADHILGFSCFPLVQSLILADLAGK